MAKNIKVGGQEWSVESIDGNVVTLEGGQTIEVGEDNRKTVESGLKTVRKAVEDGIKKMQKKAAQ